MTLKVLIFGDVIGRLGRKAMAEVIPVLKKKYKPDLVMANVENLAHGKGVTASTLEELKESGVTVFTSGNHIWARPEAFPLFEDKNFPLLRPANYPPGALGKGSTLVSVGEAKLLVVNMMGRVFFPQDYDCPFRAIDAILQEYDGIERVGTIIDFHAEATSEKVAFGYYIDGRVSAVVGTHTHVPTADNQILPGGTAYISDIGMVGGKGTVIGVDKQNVIRGFLTQLPQSWEYPETGVCNVNAVVVTIDSKTQKATKIEQVSEEVEVLV